ncbi:MAG: asparaginase [Fidelibacterota bacterium]
MAIHCNIIRGDQVESDHRVYVVVVNSGKAVVYQSGDPDYLTCVRSSLKPFQSAASVKTGAVAAAGFSAAELALMCASHNGETIHVETARSMLKKLGLKAQDYECGCHLPYDQETRRAIVAGELELTPFHNNCSGKHAGMLCLAKHLNVDPKGYVNRDHPVQQKIMETIKFYSGLDKLNLAIDGCSAPTPFLPLFTIAELFQQLASGDDPVLDQIYSAMVSNPYLVAGRQRFDTAFITALKGRAVSKVGGEGVRGIGIRTLEGETLGIAVKVIDGHKRAVDPVTVALLEHLGLLNEVENSDLETYREPLLKNHRQIIVGKIKVQIED